MEETREISALLHLIDDPDQEVFTTVSDRIISFGKSIIPNLENLWENSLDENVQERIELLIHRLHYRDLTDDFIRWKKQPEPDLLAGAMLVAKYHYPDLMPLPIIDEVEKMRRNIWLELNSYLTPLEQANIVSTILYHYYKLKGTEIFYTDPNDFLINKLLTTKKGNAINNGILYLVLCDLLDIPVKVVNIPRQFILGFFNTDNIESDNPQASIQFFIDPMSGNVYTHNDVETYFKRISVPPTPSYFKPMSNKRVIQFLLYEFAKCFDNEKNQYKQSELQQLSDLLDD